ncbi:MAG: fimbrillin family protein [Mediterranea sp.]|jgi:hypothetical protein|nr:fimbrillin family protein [Mediterranea sp.]
MIKQYILNRKSLLIVNCPLSILLRILLIILISLSFVHCQLFITDEHILQGDKASIITFSAESPRKGWLNSGHTASRISNEAWTVGDEVGIYMIPTAVTNITANEVWKNKKHIVTSLGLFPADADNTLYYPLNGTGAHFTAYYPYSSGATSTNKLTFNFTDQSTEAKKESKDFCFHRGTINYYRGTPKLNFSHRFSKILIKMSKDTGAHSLENVQVSLSNVPASATVDMAKLSANASEESNIANFGISTTATTISAFTSPDSRENAATVEAIVAPHAATGKFADRKLTFLTTDGKTRTYDLPNDLTFEAGKVYTLNLLYRPPTKVHDGMTNCFIVAPGTELKFPALRVYVHNRYLFTPYLHVDDTAPYTGAFTTAVVWDDNGVINGTPTVSGDGDYAIITVKTTSRSGNAVIKICKAGQTTPVWSYHIWVTAYDPDKNTFTNSDKNNKHTWIFMDRNLGATEAGSGLAARGLFYQWGRKDPLPGAKAGTAGFSALSKFSGMLDAGSTAVVKISGSTNAKGIVESIQKPTTFFASLTGSGTTGNWLPVHDYELWGHSGNKTIYDPCPMGWRVPVNYGMSADTTPWYGLANPTFSNGDDAAANWGTNAIYPAAGNRTHNYGRIENVGVNGNYYTASQYNGNSSVEKLLFHSNVVHSYYGYYKANGESIRCVKE